MTPSPEAERSKDPPFVDQLGGLYGQLLDAHRELSATLDEQIDAIRRMDGLGVVRATERLERTRQTIARVENVRRSLLRRATRAVQPLPFERIIQQFPDAERLRPLRQALLDEATGVSDKVRHVARVAGAVLGHLNIAARLLSRDGRYNRDGSATLTPIPSATRRLSAVA